MKMKDNSKDSLLESILKTTFENNAAKNSVEPKMTTSRYTLLEIFSKNTKCNICTVPYANQHIDRTATTNILPLELTRFLSINSIDRLLLIYYGVKLKASLSVIMSSSLTIAMLFRTYLQRSIEAVDTNT